MKNIAVSARAQIRNITLCTAAALGLAACTGDDASTSGGVDPVTGSVTNPTTPPPANPVPPATPVPSDAAPTISGQSVTSVNAGVTYSFAPVASDVNKDKLTFSIQNKPSWTGFNTATGVLTGMPTAANAGSYANIIVSVTDGTLTSALPAFALTVNNMSGGTATLDWTPPTENSDGTALTNLAGYKVYYGTSQTNMAQMVNVTNPGLSAYTVGNLAAGKWYFAITSYTTAGIESALSGIVSTTL